MSGWKTAGWQADQPNAWARLVGSGLLEELHPAAKTKTRLATFVTNRVFECRCDAELTQREYSRVVNDEWCGPCAAVVHVDGVKEMRCEFLSRVAIGIA